MRKLAATNRLDEDKTEVKQREDGDGIESRVERNILEEKKKKTYKKTAYESPPNNPSSGTEQKGIFFFFFHPPKAICRSRTYM